MPSCEEFIGIDLSDKCIDVCRKRFSAAPHARFFVNDGTSLEAAPDHTFDLIFSFDSLVHAERDIMAAYIPQVLRKLSPGGVAFLHHSNLLAYNDSIGQRHGRGLSVSANTVADLVAQHDGALLIQEVVDWGCEYMIDCLSLFGLRESYPDAKPIFLQNPAFMLEATIIRHFHKLYSTVSRHHQKLAMPNNAEAQCPAA